MREVPAPGEGKSGCEGGTARCVPVRDAISLALRPRATPRDITPARLSMATQADVRRIAMKLPGTVESTDRFAFEVPQKGKLKGFAWVWMERVVPKKPRVANQGVLAIRVANVAQRDDMIAAEPDKFFTEPHYAGYPAVLVRLKAVTAADLKVLLEEGWRCMAPSALKTSHATPKTSKRAVKRGS